jgi:tRNA threonylcarbamoyladenosine biosynthesis protein TsaB
VPNPEPLILALDTTSRRRSLAVTRGNKVLGAIGIDAAGTHSRQTHQEIDLVLKKLGLTLDNIDVFGVATGPGSFTGLRIGVTVIKGFAHVLKKAVVGVSSLEASARAANVSGLVCVCLDALRGEVYAQLFQIELDGSLQSLSEPTVALPEKVYASLVDEPAVVFVGDGAENSCEALREIAGTMRKEFIEVDALPARREGWTLLRTTGFLAPAVASLTLAAFVRGQTVTAAELEAMYVRPADAEVKWKQKRVD